MSELQQTARGLAELALAALGHALGGITAGQGPLEPFVMADREADDRAIYRFDVDSTERAREGAEAWITQEAAKIRRYAFVWDGQVTLEDRRWNAVFVEAGDRALPTAMLVCQRYVANSDSDGQSCHVGEPMLIDKPPSRLMSKSAAND